MSYQRALGDEPHYYQWQREYLYSENDRCIMLIMNMENHLKDDELFALMEAKLDEWRKIHFSSVSSNKLFLVILCSHFSLL